MSHAQSPEFVFLVGSSRSISRNAQNLPLVLCSEITSGDAQGTIYGATD